MAVPDDPNPSCLHTTPASVSFHPLSHTVPHIALKYISTLPSLDVRDPTSWMVPLNSGSTKAKVKSTYVNHSCNINHNLS